MSDDGLKWCDRFVEKWSALPAVVCQRAQRAMHDLIVWLWCNGYADFEDYRHECEVDPT